MEMLSNYCHYLSMNSKNNLYLYHSNISISVFTAAIYLLNWLSNHYA